MTTAAFQMAALLTGVAMVKVRLRREPLRPIWMDLPRWPEVRERLAQLAHNVLHFRQNRRLRQEMEAEQIAQDIASAWSVEDTMVLTDPRLKRVDRKGRPVTRFGSIMMRVVSTTGEQPVVSLPLPPARSARPGMPSLASMRQHLNKVLEIRRAFEAQQLGAHASDETSQTPDDYVPRHGRGDADQ